jgi:hypothetical protein
MIIHWERSFLGISISHVHIPLLRNAMYSYCPLDSTDSIVKLIHGHSLNLRLSPLNIPLCSQSTFTYIHHSTRHIVVQTMQRSTKLLKPISEALARSGALYPKAIRSVAASSSSSTSMSKLGSARSAGQSLLSKRAFSSTPRKLSLFFDME